MFPDLRPLQARLARLGVSSLGRAEAHVRTTVATALRACDALAGRPPGPVDTSGFDDGPARLATNARALLGPEPGERSVRIMLTLPSFAADDEGALARRAGGSRHGLRQGQHRVRRPDAWDRMVGHCRRASDKAQRSLTVLADLAGPSFGRARWPSVPGQ